MKHLLGRAAGSAPGRALMSVLERADSHAPDVVRVLTYHLVSNREGFDAQMRYLARHYQPVPVAAILGALEGGPPLPPRAVAVTFDDAYENFAEVAWPVLKRYGVPVTLFVPTAFPGQPGAYWWDELEQGLLHTPRQDTLETPAGRLPLGTPQERAQAFRRLDAYLKALPHDDALDLVSRIVPELGSTAPVPCVLGWDALRVLAAGGVTLGAHTRTHPLLTRVEAARAREEIAGSLADLRGKVGDDVPPVLAYPAGAYNSQVVAAAREAGIRLAFTTVKGANDLREIDPLRLRRINVTADATAAALRARLLLYTARLNGLREVPATA